MRDIIWTLIIIWLIYKVVAVFKNNAAKTSKNKFDSQNYQDVSAESNEKDGKSAIKKHLNTEGEYVDYEEIK